MSTNCEPKTPTKSQPRPILKHNCQPMHSILKNKTPKFFSGNEQSFIENEENELNSTAAAAAKKSFKSLKIDDDLKHGDERYKTSSLSHKPTPHSPRKFFPKKSTISAVYIFHSKEINREILKMLINSTDGFVEDFKKAMFAENFKDAELMTVFKEQFVPKLKDFLTGDCNDENSYHTKEHLYGFATTISEPLISDIHQLRKSNQKERKHILSHSVSLEKNFITNSIDESGNIKQESVYGSLPVTSFFDSFSKDIKLRENVLLRSLRSKSANRASNRDINQMTSNLSAKDLNKNIASAASTQKKIVRFADSFGLDLENVKIISNNSFVDVFSQVCYDDEEEDSMCDSSASANSKPFLVLIPLFGLKKSSDAIIKLDDYSYDYENKLIKCIIRVKNLSFKKRVYARISFNNWKSFYDLDAIYIRSDMYKTTSLNPNQHDYFGFCILIPEKASTSSGESQAKPIDDCTLRIEFAICYKQDGVEHWDNNSNENYKFQCFFNKTS